MGKQFLNVILPFHVRVTRHLHRTEEETPPTPLIYDDGL